MLTGEHLTLMREQKGLTQRAMAEKVGINYSTIARWETNRKQVPPRAVVYYRTAQKLTDLTDLEVPDDKIEVATRLSEAMFAENLDVNMVMRVLAKALDL